MLQTGTGSKKMEPNLHQKQGITHLDRVLAYAKFVTEDGRATVHLTPEDWQVVADTLFHMDTSPEMLPPSIMSYRLVREGQVVELETDGVTIELEMI